MSYKLNQIEEQAEAPKKLPYNLREKKEKNATKAEIGNAKKANTGPQTSPLKNTSLLKKTNSAPVRLTNNTPPIITVIALL